MLLRIDELGSKSKFLSFCFSMERKHVHNLKVERILGRESSRSVPVWECTKVCYLFLGMLDHLFDLEQFFLIGNMIDYTFQRKILSI